MKKRAVAALKRAVVRCSFIQAANQINILFAKNHIDLVNVQWRSGSNFSFYPMYESQAVCRNKIRSGQYSRCG